ncbi:hypothetical protein GGU11DRAFT_761156, partial [Lentinula aff. detonsa]
MNDYLRMVTNGHTIKKRKPNQSATPANRVHPTPAQPKPNNASHRHQPHNSKFHPVKQSGSSNVSSLSTAKLPSEFHLTDGYSNPSIYHPKNLADTCVNFNSRSPSPRPGPAVTSTSTQKLLVESHLMDDDSNPNSYPTSFAEKTLQKLVRDMKSDDIARLDPGRMLNDSLIEFGLRFWHHGLMISHPRLAEDVFVFNPFFYSVLEAN